MDREDEERLRDLLGSWKRQWPKAARMEDALRQAEGMVAHELGIPSPEFSQALSNDLKTLELRVAAQLLQQMENPPSTKKDRLDAWSASYSTKSELNRLSLLLTPALELSARNVAGLAGRSVGKSVDFRPIYYPEPAERDRGFYSQVLGTPFKPEDFKSEHDDRVDALRHVGTLTGRMMSSGPPYHRIPPRRAAETTMETYEDGNGNEFTPRTAHTFRDSHLINACRKMRRESRAPPDWMSDELKRRGLLKVMEAAPSSLQSQAIRRGLDAGPEGVRKVILEIRNGFICERAGTLRSWGHHALTEHARGLDLRTLNRSTTDLIDDILATEFPLLQSGVSLHRTRIAADGSPVWVDACGGETRASDFGDVYLDQVVKLLTRRHAFEEIPKGDEWVFRELVQRGLHFCTFDSLHVHHLPLISRLEHELARVEVPKRVSMSEEKAEAPTQGQVEEVLLSHLVKTQKSTKRSLFERLKEVPLHGPRKAYRKQKENTMSESTDNAMSLEEQLAAHEEEVARLKAELNAQKGIMGHPTAVMMKDGIFDGTKMVAATEAVDAINALARKIALKFFIPQGHESIIDTEQGQMFIDLAMPMALHIAATNGLFGQGSEAVGATAGYAFKGNWFKHGKATTAKVKEALAEFSGEMGQIVELGKVLMGVGEADGASMLAEVTDFAETLETVGSKEKVEVKKKA